MSTDNYITPDWMPLERAVTLANLPISTSDRFMWMQEQPAGYHHYKHIDTRNYAHLSAASTPEECMSELAVATSMERTWGKDLDARLAAAQKGTL